MEWTFFDGPFSFFFFCGVGAFRVIGASSLSFFLGHPGRLLGFSSFLRASASWAALAFLVGFLLQGFLMWDLWEGSIVDDGKKKTEEKPEPEKKNAKSVLTTLHDAPVLNLYLSCILL